MDYRKPAVFGENWSDSRYQVLPYFAWEKALLANPRIERILDVGCANGWNMSRFRQYGRLAIGLDLVPERVRLAQQHGPVLQGSGLQLPVAAGSADVVYIQHVLHHIGDLPQALSEARRVMKEEGLLFLVETVEDNPLIRWGRRRHASWLGDAITAPFTFAGLQAAVRRAGLEIIIAEQYSVLFWLWETLPDQLPIMEKLTPLVVPIERLLAHFWKPYSAHCFLVARLP